MPRFQCKDIDCECYSIEELIPAVKFIWNDKSRRLEAEEAVCKGCGNQREVVKEPGPITIPWFKAENSRNYDNRKIKRFKDY